jgi:hypothetical protein
MPSEKITATEILDEFGLRSGLLYCYRTKGCPALGKDKDGGNKKLNGIRITRLGKRGQTVVGGQIEYEYDRSDILKIVAVSTLDEKGRLKEVHTGKAKWFCSAPSAKARWGFPWDTVCHWRRWSAWLSRRIVFLEPRLVRAKGRADMRVQYLYLEDDFEDIELGMEARRNNPENPWWSTEEAAAFGFTQRALEYHRELGKLDSRAGVRLILDKDGKERSSSITEWNPAQLIEIKRDREAEAALHLAKKNSRGRYAGPPRDPVKVNGRIFVPTAWILKRFPDAREQNLSTVAARGSQEATRKPRTAPSIYKCKIGRWNHWDLEDILFYARYRRWPIDSDEKKSNLVAESVSNQPPFVPSWFQRRVLDALNGKVMTADKLQSHLHCDRRNLYRDGLDPLKKAGLLLNDRRVGGYYRPDTPPQEFAEFFEK